ncbi:MAG TPA: hypothetical protein VG841_14450 [Caulobacterales bacterium]|nr:hypothetical protein [Caulobacterales bacterium]
MTLSPSHKKALAGLARSRTRAELKSLFAAIRAHDDKDLLAALAAPPKSRARRDPLVRDVELALRPVLGPSAEKADLLVEFMARGGAALEFEPRGLADAVRRLRRSFSDAQIRAAAAELMAEVALRYSNRETVV